MTTPTQRDLATAVAHSVVAELANRELDDFAETAEEYWRNPRRVRGTYGDGDDVLGFGGVEAAIITPAALYIATEVVKFLLESVKGGLGELIGDFFKDLVGSGPKKNGAAPQAQSQMLHFSSEQLDQAHKVGRKAAKELGLPADKTELLVNAVVVHFARAAAQQAPSPTR